MRSRITAQSVLSLVISLVILVVIALVLIQIQYSVNERAISSLADDNIRIISRIIQYSVDEIDDITVEILSNNGIQNYDSSRPDYIKNQQELRNFADLFSSYQIFKPFIETFYIVFNNDISLSIGKVQELFTKTFFQSREKELERVNGRMIVSPFPGDPSKIIISREIRRIKNLDQSHIASLYIVVDLGKLLDVYFQKYGIKDIRLFLLQKNGALYSYENRQSEEVMNKAIKRDSGVFPISGRYFYLHWALITNTGWKVYILLPFTNIVKLRDFLMYVSFAGLILGLLGLSILGRTWSARITRPIIKLADTMRDLQSTDFSDRNPALPEYGRNDDEIAILYDNFDNLLKKVDFLIHENYKKQLMLKETQLQNLIAQINPHFIYNTLDTISWMAWDKETDRISELVQALSLLLRASISSENIITLEEETELLKGYLKIQKIRFHERLHYEIKINCPIQELRVPSMILQPIVENSIKYSLDIPKSSVSLVVEVFCSDGFIQLRLSDDGPGISRERLNEILQYRKSDSIGLGNIHHRLKIFYGDRAQLLIRSELGEGTEVTVKIPMSGEKE